jgi:uncharacterized protein
MHLGTHVTAVRSLPDGGVVIVTEKGEERYDHVIIATHSDATLKMLEAGGGASEAEREAFGGVKWNRNRMVLHSDERVGFLIILR